MTTPAPRNVGGPFQYVAATQTDLASVLNPKIGELALVLDDGSIWYHTGTVWASVTGSSNAIDTLTFGGNLV